MKRYVFLICVISLVIAGAIAGTYSYLYFGARQQVDRWLPLSPGDIQSVEISGPGGNFTLAREEGSWIVQSGNRDRATARGDETRINGLFDFLVTSIPVEAEPDFDTSDAVNYGMAKAKLTLTFQLRNKAGNKTEVRVLIGDQLRDENIYFAWTSANRPVLYQVSGDFLDRFRKDAAYYYDLRVFDFKSRDVVKVEQARKLGGEWSVVRKDESFGFETPVYLQDRKVSKSAMRQFFTAVEELRAAGFVVWSKELPKTPDLVIKVWTDPKAKPTQADFYRMSGTDNYYLGVCSRQPGVFRVPLETVRALIRRPYDLQRRTVVSLDMGSLQTLRMTTDGRTVAAVKKDNGWVDKSTGKALTGIDMALWRFNELKFEALPLSRLPDRASLLVRCTFLDESGAQVADLAFFSDPKLPKGQSWIGTGNGLFYPVEDQLVRDLIGLFPADK